MKRPVTRWAQLAAGIVVGATLVAAQTHGTPGTGKTDIRSTCYGTTANGSLEGGVSLPLQGENFNSYSLVASTMGRTYVHSTVRQAVLDAYGRMAGEHPGKVFVYGETGKRKGGPFPPHKTHQNGLSVDFMVPVVDGEGRSVRLPTSMANRYGYDLEFDERGRLGDLRIDFPALAAHLEHLHRASLDRGIAIRKVILDPELQSFLWETPSWDYLSENARFSKTRAWVRHDEHYHVDFEVDCRP